MRIQRALISVADKAGIAEFAHGLAQLGIEIVSSGGTAIVLQQTGLTVETVESVTDHPEILGGRVKTLHPAVHGGILARRGHAGDAADLLAHGIKPVDLVVVNLYPFESMVADPTIVRADAIEQIDIGGTALLRAAAKNHAWVGVVSDTAQYATVLAELTATSGELSDATRETLAVDAFERTAAYDRAISNYLRPQDGDSANLFPDQLTLQLQRVHTLRYGENPHQQAVWYVPTSTRAAGLAALQQLGGKELSYNNVLDAGTALAVVWEFAEPAACVVKHLSPCGVAVNQDLAQAVRAAQACDPISAFGGIVGINRVLDVTTATAILALGFLEVIVAPEVEPAAATLFAKKKNLRILSVGGLPPPGHGLPAVPWDMRTIAGSVLVQTPDVMADDISRAQVVTQRPPSTEEHTALGFAWRAVKHVRSNAIVIARGTALVGIGGGLPSRVDAVHEGIRKAGGQARGAVLASDAFFPKIDNIECAATAGITAIIQPGGSKADADVIAAADAAGIAMLCTGRRHFKH